MNAYGPDDVRCDCGCGWVASQGRDADDVEGTARRLGALWWVAVLSAGWLLGVAVVAAREAVR